MPLVPLTISAIMESQSAYKAFFSFLRAEGVSAIELEGIRLEILKDKPAPYVGELQAPLLPEMTEEQKQKEHDDLLFHSSG
jgi:hypothetical protein